MTVVVVLISRFKSGERGSTCPLKREQARRETQQWVMRRFPTADSIVEIGRKSRSWINNTKSSCRRVLSGVVVCVWSCLWLLIRGTPSLLTALPACRAVCETSPVVQGSSSNA